jgi:hypothetical protein
MATRYSPKIVTDGLVLCLDAGNVKSYPGSGTTWNDISRNNNNGTLTNGPTFATTYGGNFTVDGTDDTVTTEIPITFTPALSNFTYEAWTSISSFPSVVSPANQYGSVTKVGVLFGATYYCGAALYWYGDSAGTSCTMYGYIRGSDSYRNTNGYGMSINTIYQFVLVNNYGAGTLNLYVNGNIFSSVATATQEYNPSLTPSAGNIGFCKSQIDGGGTQNYVPYAGKIYAGKIYKKALSAQEVLQNYNATKRRFGL